MTNDIFIYAPIGDEWGGVTAEGVASALKAANGGNVNVRISSPGGSVSEGVAIYNLLKSHTGKVTAVVDGIAASIASVVAMGASEVVMGEGAMLFIHMPLVTDMAGNAEELRKTAAELDKFGSIITDIYAARTGMERARIEEIMLGETYLTAQEAVDMKFADRIGKLDAAKINNRVNMSFVNSFANAMPVAAALKDAGFEFNVDTVKALIEKAKASETFGVSEKVIKAFEAAGLNPSDAATDEHYIAKALAKVREDAESEAAAASKDQVAIIAALTTEKNEAAGKLAACSSVITAIGCNADATPEQIMESFAMFSSKQAARVLANHGAQTPIADAPDGAPAQSAKKSDSEIFKEYKAITDDAKKLEFYRSNSDAIWRASRG